MDKKTLLAVVLSVVVIVGSMLVQSIFFPAPSRPAAPPVEQPAAAAAQRPEAPAVSAGAAAVPAPLEGAAEEAEVLREEKVTIDTKVFRVTLSNRGAVATSIQLKEFTNTDGRPVEMVVSRETDRYPFLVRFGDPAAPPEYALFRVERSLTDSNRVDFVRQFRAPSGVPFTLRKTYIFKPNDYLLELQISIENSVNEYPQLNSQGLAYTLAVGPQIGPEFVKLDRKSDYRSYMVYAGGKKRDIGLGKGKDAVKTQEERVSWAAIVGKYFTVIGIPDATEYRVTFDGREVPGLADRSSLLFGRPALQSSRATDVFRFYVGPKKRDILADYNDPQKNGFGTQGLHLEETVPTSPLLGWLANILKFFLEMFHQVVPNYGVAILLLTLLIKIVFWPLTHKSFESTSKMQALNPKLTELREKYKSNPQKLNQEMAALYKREGVSPLGGCLPMLLQLPILFAMYALLNDFFDLRGATFIPGWIDDLSVPEAVLTFQPVSLLFFEISALRILPLIMLVTTFLQSKLTQTGGAGASGGQMKMMMYLMPLVFFFIMYDLPSGLVLYWTAQNVLSIVQQLWINRRMKRPVPAPAVAPSGPARDRGKPRGRR